MNEVSKNEEKKLTKREKILMAGTAVVVGAISWKLGSAYNGLCIARGLQKICECEANPGLKDTLIDGISNYWKTESKS